MWLREFAASYFVSINKELNPKLWEGATLMPEVREKLIKIAEAFREFIAIDLDVVDYTMTGSNANYTWTKYSDLDLHIIVNGEVGPEARELFNAKKALWAEHHDITIRGLPVECYVQGENERHHSSGVFSVMHDKWLMVPRKIKPKIDDSAVERKLDAVTHDITMAVTAGDIGRLEKMKERITNMRKSGLERAGEWSTENLAFKALRNMGVIDQLTEKIRELEDQDLSL
jgi:hypothetical protein